MIVALTGGSGFVGKAVADQLIARGHQIRALVRRDQPPRDGVTWVDGSLDRPGSLASLVAGTDAVLHVAGVVNGSAAEFISGNVDGTRHLIAAARTAGVRRFVHVSSLAAREPSLSLYGRSKAKAEEVVAASGLDWTIVRPPGVYGPGDMDQRDLFRAARLGVVPLPPGGRLSIIHVEDLARLLVALIDTGGASVTYEPEQPDGPLTHAAFARAIGAAVGRRVLPLHLPAALLALAARGDRLLRGQKARLTADRVAYMIHPDWSVDSAKRPPPEWWTARIDAATGLAGTAAWYRAHHLL